MKVSVYKVLGDGMAILVQASPGMGRAPIMISGITRKNLKEKVLPVVEGMRGRKKLEQTTLL